MHDPIYISKLNSYLPWFAVRAVREAQPHLAEVDPDGAWRSGAFTVGWVLAERTCVKPVAVAWAALTYGIPSNVVRWLTLCCLSSSSSFLVNRVLDLHETKLHSVTTQRDREVGCVLDAVAFVREKNSVFALAATYQLQLDAAF